MQTMTIKAKRHQAARQRYELKATRRKNARARHISEAARRWIKRGIDVTKEVERGAMNIDSWRGLGAIIRSVTGRGPWRSN